MALFRRKSTIPAADAALPGRSTPLKVPETHFVNGHRIVPPFPAGLREAVFGLGCFWGAEKLFWQLPGVYSTAVGYAGGFTPNPTYQEVCSGDTGQAEVVRVIYDPSKVSYGELLQAFWESPGYCHCNFTVLASFPDELARRWTEALLAMTFEDPCWRPVMEMEGVRRWVAADAHILEGYNCLLEAVETQGLTKSWK